ncbi:winged helix-turn-helix transcriptional regulator [Leucobacter viscericola]|uniref:Winged helix-turn-helix transcriptional regulator n=1 Tax=Leucobacter viscericola TaxID=2714935 RepID=A0A6G7XG69_9MICO|nr:MarR family winged helix-turn-helix transcriptional regulator [Leucobacter viscericola]QIK63555.1 winged helix-turn-helix transcriptional regulator [Leucobacter viscericola]
MSELSHGERVAIARLRALIELLPTTLDRHLADSGIHSFEYTLLEALYEADDSRLQLSALATRTNATLPRLSRVVSGLERKGLIVRVACPHDGRATNAELTAEGERVFLSVRPLYDAALRTLIFDELGSAGTSALAEITYTILAKLDPGHRFSATDAEAESVSDCAADPAPPKQDCPADPSR